MKDTRLENFRMPTAHATFGVTSRHGIAIIATISASGSAVIADQSTAQHLALDFASSMPSVNSSNASGARA
jgi:hypothetical protein